MWFMWFSCGLVVVKNKIALEIISKSIHMYTFSSLPREIERKIHEYVDYSDFVKNRYESAVAIIHYAPLMPQPIIIDNVEQEYIINMMPFILGDHDTLPEECKRYIPILDKCLENCKNEKYKVCYLTIHESFVEAGCTQRRPGLHVESIGMKKESGFGTHYFVRPSWGGSNGGIFMMSNVDNTTVAYDCFVNDVAIGHNGSVEHLRTFLDNKKYKNPFYLNEKEQSVFYKLILKKNELCWITDSVPHESLPVKEKCFRQFFRLVTSENTVWYSKHCTKNPFGIIPDPKITTIVEFDKFKNKKVLDN